MTELQRHTTTHLTLQQLLKWTVLFLLAGAVCTYIVFQARHLIIGPQVLFTDTLSSNQHDRTITISGITRNITALELNGKTLYTDATGAFQKSLVLENGYTIMTIRATDRFGRTTSVTRPFVYTPS